ncbi:alkenal reductase NADP(+)-dependent [Seminavis robusta]|uniref:Alkenal reductase NADP(+)-dependent n=1 Tax=Seminavis robusta TaxID=568900 RepID=A0A9N8HUA6_9STRA|nr:alkenal reductase NADP(+)-dependent [Seminavis robusta]|eukprot:Sro1718_g293330.1 alkenal reductase (NADP(+)-dependent (385) ;mRNA; f:12634-13788
MALSSTSARHGVIPAIQTVIRMMQRPVGEIVPGKDLVASQEPTPTVVGNDQVLLQRLYLSLDPAMRGWMRDIPSYMPPVQVGAVMRGYTISQVVVAADGSQSGRFQVGDIVVDNSMVGGWDQYAVVPAKKCSKLPMLDNNIPMTAHLSVLGLTGMTAYFGLMKVGKPQPGETILVSAAAGATGSVVAQIAKNVVGCKVVGIAGGPQKCQWLLDQVGCDAVIDYKLANGDGRKFQKQLQQALKQVDSKGYDIFFDNVGGFILNETLRRLNLRGRVVLCGAISGYNVEDQRSTQVVPPTNYMALISLRAKIEGFIVTDYVREYKEAKRQMAEWIAQGKIKYKEDVREGLEQAPEHLKSLFNGGNTGKLIVKVGEPMTGTTMHRSKL